MDEELRLLLEGYHTWLYQLLGWLMREQRKSPDYQREKMIGKIGIYLSDHEMTYQDIMEGNSHAHD
jgi:hypothetical protein